MTEWLLIVIAMSYNGSGVLLNFERFPSAEVCDRIGREVVRLRENLPKRIHVDKATMSYSCQEVPVR